jgi:hypothetical protein
LIIITYVVGLGFLLFAGFLREVRFIFPAWVFVVSIYILNIDYRQSNDELSKANPLTIISQVIPEIIYVPFYENSYSPH